MRISNPHPPTSFELLIQSMLTELRQHSHAVEGQTFHSMRRERLARVLAKKVQISNDVHQPSRQS